MLRLAAETDSQGIQHLGASVYPHNHFEGVEAVRTKILGYPAGCFVKTVNGELAGYVLSFPYEMGLEFPLNLEFDTRRAAQPSCHYIHDLCVGRRWQGQGYGEELAGAMFRIPLWPKTLTAVCESQWFWRLLGFQIIREVNYAGSRAVYMVKY
jgi:hypothetical protein